MEIERTFIVEYKSFPDEKRFVKVYLSKGRYFLQIKEGAIKAGMRGFVQYFNGGKVWVMIRPDGAIYNAGVNHW